MPEKKRMNARWVRLSKKWEFVLWKGFIFPSALEDTIFACVLFDADRVVGFVMPLVAAGARFNFASATLLGSVSGRQ